LLAKFILKTVCVVATPLLIAGCVQPLDPVVKTDAGTSPNAEHVRLYGNQSYTKLERHTFSEVGADFDPFVTANGKKIIYASTRISEMSDIFIKDPDSKVVSQITRTNYANEKQPQLSPDGNRIIFASDRSGKWGIYETSAKNFGNTHTEIVSNGRVNEQPCYSPNGKSIAYATWLPREANWYIATMDLKTQRESLHGPGVFPKFSPDGKKLLFQRPRSRAPQWYSIWVLNVDSGSVSEIVSNNNWAAVTPNWSPDGKKIIFAAINKSIHDLGEKAGDEIYVIRANGTHLIRLTEDRYSDWNPFWSKSGRIFFISKRNGHQNIWSMKPRELDRFHPDSIETQVDNVTRLDGLE
jgi:TolB protein